MYGIVMKFKEETHMTKMLKSLMGAAILTAAITAAPAKLARICLILLAAKQVRLKVIQNIQRRWSPRILCGMQRH